MIIDQWQAADGEGRSELACGFLESVGIAEDEQVLLLNRYRTERDSGRFEPEILPALFLSLFQLRDGETSDVALLDFYYSCMETEGETFGTLLEILRSVSADPFDVTDVHRRARMHWVHIAIARYFDKDDEGIREYIEDVHRRGESKAYVWDRIFGAIWDWKGLWRLYPQILTWETDFDETPEKYREIVDSVGELYSEALDVTRGVRSRMETCLRSVARGTMELNDFRRLLGTMAERDAPFPFDADELQRILDGGSPLARALLLDAAFVFRDGGNASRAEDAAAHLLTDRTIQDAVAADPYFRLAEWTWRRGGDWSGVSPRVLWEESLRVADFVFAHAPDSSSTWHEIGDFFEAFWLYVLDGGFSPSLADSSFGRFLEHTSAYIRKASSSVLLTLARKGCDLAPVLPQIRHCLEKDASVRGPLSTGEDLPSDDRLRPETFPTPTLFYSPDVESGEADGFFNLGNLTGLLEACQPPHVAYRLIEVLRIHADAHPNDAAAGEIRRELAAYDEMNREPDGDAGDSQPEGSDAAAEAAALPAAGTNAADEDHLRTSEFLTSEDRAVRLVVPDQVGPLTLPDIVDFFRSAAEGKTGTDDIRDDLARRAKELECRLGRGNTSAQRAMIRKVFEGPETEVPDTPFTSLYRRWRQENPDDSRREPVVFAYGPEESPDYLACYLPESGFGSARGIYFHVKRMLEAIGRGSVDPLWSVRTIAVHELVHFFVESMMDPRTYKGHGHSDDPVPWCRLEEAAANRAARQWLMDSGSEPVVRNRIDGWLFRPEYDGRKGLPGYGEWNRLDSTAIGLLVSMLEGKLCDPERFGTDSTQLLASWDLVSRRRTAESLWTGILDDLDGMQVPFFLDFVN